MNVKMIHEGPDQCQPCDGYGEVNFEGASRKVWEELPAQSRIALTMGLVDFKPCPTCGGTGRHRAAA